MTARSIAAMLVLAAILAGAVAAGRSQEADPAPLPYDAEMQRLSEIMGALHFLQQLCDGVGSSPWRDEMTALLEAEQPDVDRRAHLVDAFNRGYESHRSVYRMCGDSAELAMQRYHQEGMRIALDIGSRYGSPDGE